MDCVLERITPRLLRCCNCGRELRTRRPAELYSATCRQAASIYDTCAHRGEALRDVTCTICGRRGELMTVFACAVHGECVLRRWKAGSQGVAVCLGCEEHSISPKKRLTKR